MTNILDFWSALSLGQKTHPDDDAILARSSHELELECLPSPFIGPIRTASIVLLYLNSGLSQPDHDDARTEAGKRRCLEQLHGNSPLPSKAEHAEAYGWLLSRTKRISDWENVRRSLAVLELCPYHSKSFNDWPLLASLPSCRASLDWAQQVLFPDAEAGKRVVICLRAAKYWGLKQGEQYGISLFAPTTVRGGHMANEPLKDIIVKAAQKKLGVLRGQ